MVWTGLPPLSSMDLSLMDYPPSPHRDVGVEGIWGTPPLLRSPFPLPKVQKERRTSHGINRSDARGLYRPPNQWLKGPLGPQIPQRRTSMSQCFTCNSPEFTLDSISGVMTCENGHPNYVGTPDHYSSSKEIDT